MDIKINETGEAAANVVCIHLTQKNDSKSEVLGVLCYDRKNGDKFYTTEDFAKLLMKGKTIAWSGRYDKESESFKNVSMVYPCKNEKGTLYLRSAEDTSTKNNLLELPDYAPDE